MPLKLLWKRVLYQVCSCSTSVDFFQYVFLVMYLFSLHLCIIMPKYADMTSLHYNTGGGVALLYASKELDKLPTANFDQKIGVQIIQNALKVWEG